MPFLWDFGILHLEVVDYQKNSLQAYNFEEVGVELWTNSNIRNEGRKFEQLTKWTQKALQT